MKTIKYYDRINNKYIDLEVNDEVAKFLRSDNKRLHRQINRDRENIAFSLDEKTDYDGEEALTYHELIEDKKANVEKILEKKEFAKCVWRIVDELEEKQAKIIKGYFKFGYKNKELANYLNMTTSAFSQFKATALKHLHILFSFDPEFSNTQFYQAHYKDFADDVIDEAKKFISKDFISIDLGQVMDLIKNATQIKKIAEKKGIKIPITTLKQIENMTKPVWEFLKQLKQNGKFNSNEKVYLNIPNYTLLKEIEKYKN